MAREYRNGFTLLELSMVLMAISLMAGGIFVGREMIRDAMLRNTVGDVAKYTQAFHNFQDKYKALPGDFNNAESIWGSDASCPNTPSNTTLKKATCNGNGDGYIADNGVAGAFQPATSYESFRAWQQLSAAGMLNDVAGSAVFTGTSSSGSYNTTPGVNVPQTSLPQGGFTVMHIAANTSRFWNTNSVINKHVFFVGTSMSSYFTFAPLFTANEMYHIDVKLDDGLPGSGNIQVFDNTLYNTSCSTSATAYNIANNKIICSGIFVTDF